jgi:hypothetical protein
MAYRKKRKKKRKLMESNVSSGNGYDQSVTVIDQKGFVYLEVLYPDVRTLKPLMRDYFLQVKAKDEGENEVKLTHHLEHIKLILQTNPLARMYAAYSEEPDLPLNIEGEAIGYIYFYISQTIHSERFLFIDQLYTKPEYKRYLTLIKHLPSIAFSFAKRIGVDRIDIEVRDQKVQQHWKYYGFKTDSARMSFRGNAVDFENYRLLKATKTIRNKEGALWEANKANLQNPARKQPQ